MRLISFADRTPSRTPLGHPPHSLPLDAFGISSSAPLTYRLPTLPLNNPGYATVVYGWYDFCIYNCDKLCDKLMFRVSVLDKYLQDVLCEAQKDLARLRVDIGFSRSTPTPTSSSCFLGYNVSNDSIHPINNDK